MLGDSFSGVHVFHCPMAPKPGLWVQLNPGILNPFFGAKMATCGDEVVMTKPVPVARANSAPEMSHSQDKHSSSTDTAMAHEHRTAPKVMREQAMTTNESPTGPVFHSETKQPSDTSGFNAHADRLLAVMSARDELKNQARARAIAERATAIPPPPFRLTSTQVDVLNAFLKDADQVGRTLADENLSDFNRSISRLTNHFSSMQQYLSMPPRWGPEHEGARVLAEFGHADPMEDARRSYAPFAKLTGEFIRQLVGVDPAFKRLKVYRASPEAGGKVWMQLEGPPVNPFEGTNAPQPAELPL
jgi:hypothetical protein